MKHLLDIKNFITEALPLEFQKKYKPFFEKRPKEVIDRLNKLLDNQERVYIPYNSDEVSETQKKVDDYLKTIGYDITDYKLNQAVQIENNKRTIRISKLLAKQPELLKEFTLDDIRANTRVGSEFSIVLTSNYEDVAGMSFDRCWTNSCLNIQSGVNKKYVKDEVKQGTVVAYLIKSDDLEITNPLGRVNIKPYVNGSSTTSRVIYAPDKRIYGNIPDPKLFLKKIEEYLNDKQIVEYAGTYVKRVGLYSDDGSPSFIKIRKNGYDENGYDEQGYDEKGYNKEGYNKEGYNEKGYNKQGYNKLGYDEEGRNKSDMYDDYLTMEQYNFLSVVIVDSKTRSFPEVNPYSINDNGFVDTEYSVRLGGQFSYLNKLPISFGVVKGSFVSYGGNLDTLEGAPKQVYGDFIVSNNRLKTLLGGPVEVNGIYAVNNNELIDLLGAPENIGRSFDCSFNQLTSLEGAPKKVRGYFDCRRQLNGVRFSMDQVIDVCEVGYDQPIFT